MIGHQVRGSNSIDLVFCVVLSSAAAELYDHTNWRQVDRSGACRPRADGRQEARETGGPDALERPIGG
jgi:hypothetical protein